MTGFNTTVYTANTNSGFGTVTSLNKALELISNPAYQASATTAATPAPDINFMDSGSASFAHFDASQTGSLDVADQPFPGLTVGLSNYAGVATGTLTIPAGALTQTFGVNSREGFRMTFTGQTFTAVTGGDTGVSGSGVGTSTMSWSTNRLPGDTLGTITFPSAGTYTFSLEWYGNTSGSEVELYSAPVPSPRGPAGSPAGTWWATPPTAAWPPPPI